MEMCSFSRFLSLTLRNISPEIFFDCLLSDKDLSKLLCTCRGMKEKIIQWKNVFPTKYLEIGESMTSKMFKDMILHYSKKIKSITISFETIWTLKKGYRLLTLLESSILIELNIKNCLGKELLLITSSLTDLRTLRIGHMTHSKAVDSVTRLTNLVEIELFDCINKNSSVLNYSSLINIASMTLIWCQGLTEKGLRYLVLKKDFLVQLEIKECHAISSEGFHCLTTLTNLTNLTINVSQFDDIGLNMICSSCLLIEYLNVQKNDVTIEGFNNIHCLIYLKTLFLPRTDNRLLKKLIHNNNNLKIISSCD
jgi:hypothetical protein